MNTTNLKNVGQKIMSTLNRNSPTILTGLSVAGLITTTVMAIRATPKALEILDQESVMREDHYGKVIPLTKMDILKLTWKCYLPTGLMGLATIGCMIGATSINEKRNAALSGLYALTETTLKEYQAKVVETIGENKERKIKEDVAGDRIKNNPVNKNQVIITEKGNTLCYDSISGRYFKSDIEKLRKIENEINKNLISDMWISLNEVYDKIGLNQVSIGNDIGWNVDSLLDFHFSSKLTEEGEPCIVLDYSVEPRFDFRK